MRAALGSFVVLALGALAGCGAAPRTRAAGAVAPLAVRPVPWNPGNAPVGRVSAVADAGAVVAVLGDAGVTVLSSGAVVATDRTVTDWVDARTVRGADGSSRWIVAIDGKGRLYYLRGTSSFEDVSARYGLEGRRVLGAAELDPARVGFLLDGEVDVADGRRVTRYAAPAPLVSLAGGGGGGVATSRGAVVLFDATMAARTFPVPGVTHAAIGADGRLYASTPRALYASTERGDLALLYDAGADTLHGLVASGSHVWLADGAELAVVDGDHVAETSGVRIPPDARLAASPSGDVWVVASNSVRRYARVGPEPALEVAWSSTLAPIFARSCASCHLPGGISGTDLSTAEAWESEKTRIAERVVTGRTMPPEGHPLADADRAAIAAWVGSR
jgi:hypothetical protein